MTSWSEKLSRFCGRSLNKIGSLKVEMFLWTFAWWCLPLRQWNFKWVFDFCPTTFQAFGDHEKFAFRTNTPKKTQKVYSQTVQFVLCSKASLNSCICTTLWGDRAYLSVSKHGSLLLWTMRTAWDRDSHIRSQFSLRRSANPCYYGEHGEKLQELRTRTLGTPTQRFWQVQAEKHTTGSKHHEMQFHKKQLKDQKDTAMTCCDIPWHCRVFLPLRLHVLPGGITILAATHWSPPRIHCSEAPNHELRRVATTVVTPWVAAKSDRSSLGSPCRGRLCQVRNVWNRCKCIQKY